MQCNRRHIATNNMGLWIHIVSFLLVFLVSFGVFYNSIGNEFAFDDHLAIVNNKDTDPNTPFEQLWGNDIWGKDLLAQDSHRSYRPLLIVAFRVIRSLYGLDAAVIRIVSISSHAISSALVYVLGTQITSNYHIALGSALAFASHPVHVESVAAVVNMAEPLSCIFYCLALTIYLMWFDICGTPTPGPPPGMTTWGVTAWIMSTLVWLWAVIVSILFKETGITLLAIIFGSSALSLFAYTIRMLIGKPNRQDITGDTERSSAEPTGATADKDDEPPAGSNTAGRMPSRRLVSSEGSSAWLYNHIAWMVLSVFVIIGYFVFRAVLVSPDQHALLARLFSASHNDIAVESCESSENQSLSHFLRQLMSIASDTVYMLGRLVLGPFLPVGQSSAASTSSFYLDESQLIRKAENPFAFLDPTEKAMSLLYLHFRYFFLLLWPQKLCSEYAFDCIPKVTSWTDEGRYRLVYPLLMYSALIVTALYGLMKALFRSTDRYFLAGICGGSHPDNLSSQAPFSTLTAIMLLVIPFIPAAGVFLRLGTLLAERLLYIPSIGFCYLLCMFLYSVCKRLCGLLSNWCRGFSTDVDSRTVSRRALTAHTMLYWSIVLVIVAMYAQRSTSRNLDWKDDSTLHMSSLHVCPRSAKLQLQVTKLKINEGRFAEAAEHIALAKEIDPDFCDVWYQEALMNIAYYHDEEAAIEKLSDSLHCIFTSTGAWALLSKIWEQQMQQSPNDYRIVENIGNVCIKAEMYLMAVRQYQQAASKAFELGQYVPALKTSIKAERALMKLYRQQFGEDAPTSGMDIEGSPEKISSGRPGLKPDIYDWLLMTSGQAHNPDSLSWQMFREIQCNTYSLGGLIRSTLYDKSLAAEDPGGENPDVRAGSKIAKNQKSANKKTSTKQMALSPALRKEAARRKDLLRMGMMPLCVFDTSDPEDKMINTPHDVTIPQYPIIVISTLTNILSKEYQQVQSGVDGGERSLSHAEKTQELAEFTFDAARTYAEMYRVKSRMADFIMQPTYSNSDEVLDKNLQLIHNQMNEAVESSIKFWEGAGQEYFHLGEFKKAEYCFDHVLKFDLLYAKQNINDGGDDDHEGGESYPTEFIKAPCSTRYWYAHAISAQEGFSAAGTRDLQRVRHLLQTVVGCREDGSVTADMRRKARMQLQDINSYMEDSGDIPAI